jgi:hypothetical protein
VHSADQYVWTQQFTGSSLTTVKFLADPHIIMVETYNLSSGEKTKSVTLPLKNISGSSYSVRSLIGWQGNVLWVMIANQIMAIDAEKGTIIFTN